MLALLAATAPAALPRRRRRRRAAPKGRRSSATTIIRHSVRRHDPRPAERHDRQGRRRRRHDLRPAGQRQPVRRRRQRPALRRYRRRPAARRPGRRSASPAASAPTSSTAKRAATYAARRRDDRRDRRLRRNGTDTLSYATGVTPGFPNNESSFFDYAGFPDEAAGAGAASIDQTCGDTASRTTVSRPPAAASTNLSHPERDFESFEVVDRHPLLRLHRRRRWRLRAIYGGGGADVILGGGGDHVYGGAGGDYCDSGSTSMLRARSGEEKSSERDHRRSTSAGCAGRRRRPGPRHGR